ncbi:MAG: PSD1 and planctomycete cytochrome C domain-containing protein [Pirellulales bacterium]|nr:PSD1 and planctomycete cytochrome C domain-containing protein [Pirellulales bacterium]
MLPGNRLPLPLVFAFAGLLGAGASAAEPADQLYLREVKPVLERRCYACHGALSQRNNLRLDTAASILAGGDSGPAVEPGQPEQSLLYRAITGADDAVTMPLEGKPLAAEEVAAVGNWIAAGAPQPAGELPQPRPEDHWSFRPPRRAALPAASRDASATSNPIDLFLGAAQHAAGVQPVAPAPPELLLRRVYIDLVGVPPTRAELSRFLADPSDEAYRRVVDELLASPLYGQRWGRHWMDVWRYADWAGYGAEVRDSQLHIWHWRDWIIESLNADRGYDQMIREMLAGDEIAPLDQQTLRATGFLARNWYRFNRNVWLDNAVEHTSKAFLGLTFNCARCHDHKYDPIAQTDYYRLRACFEPHQIRAERLPGQSDVTIAAIPRAYDADPGTPTYLFVRGNEADPDKQQSLSPGLPSALAPESLAIVPVPLPVAAYYPGYQPYVQLETLAAAQAAVAAATDDAQRGASALALAALEARVAADRARYGAPVLPDAHEVAKSAQQREREAAVAAAEVAANQATAAVDAAQDQVKAKPDDPSAKQSLAKAEEAAKAASERLAAARNALAQPLDGNYTPLTAVYPATSTGRRLALARWIADGRNPLTARVAVNHIWLRHFGSALVESVFDFGHHGSLPAHPELLDWLAVELVEHGWSMKHLHRLIVTAEAYRRMSTARDAQPQSLAADPDNRLLWRMNPRRMEAEVVRDSLLAISGSLDASPGGPDLPHDQGLSSLRRSVYFQHAHEKQMTFLKLFDAASMTECYRRTESIVPQQGLALANSDFVRNQARQIAATLAAQPPEQFIDAAFETALSRAPSRDERQACLKFLERQQALLAAPERLTAFADATDTPARAPERRAREDLVHVLLNHNDFVTIR